jgi:hypothetical protein
VAASASEDASRRRARLVAAAVAGAALGLVVRELPLAAAGALLGPSSTGPCGMEEVLACVARDSGTLLVEVVRLAAVAALIAGAGALAGVTAVVLGLVSRRPVASPLFVGGGVLLAVPGLWLAGSFLRFVVG